MARSRAATVSALLSLAAAFAPVPRQRAPLRAAPLFAKETLQDKIYAWQDQFIAGLTKDDKAKTTPAPAPAPKPAPKPAPAPAAKTDADVAAAEKRLEDVEAAKEKEAQRKERRKGARPPE